MQAAYVKLEISVPFAYLRPLRDALNPLCAEEGNHYDMVCTWFPVTGCWRPLAGSRPYLGQEGQICTAEEYRLEMRCKKERLPDALRVIRENHPYEEPLINILPLLDPEA